MKNFSFTWEALKNKGTIYLIEAWTLGMFMVSAALLTILLEHPDFPTRQAIPSLFLRRLLLTVYITFEAPFSGMSINPARTMASAFPAQIREAWWIYFIGPVTGMQLAGYLYRKGYRIKNNGNCTTMKCHMSGNPHDCSTYQVLNAH